MHPFAVGGVVICVDDLPLPDRIPRYGEPWIKVGRAYRIESVSVSEPGEYGVKLAGVENWPPSCGWHAWRFRKLEPASEEFQRLLAREPVVA